MVCRSILTDFVKLSLLASIHVILIIFRMVLVEPGQSRVVAFTSPGTEMPPWQFFYRQ
jgi:hypothetical protein